ncbi:MAG: hypothetical protein WCD70_14920 [Alphaproteobacteria bacterium]
MSDTWTTEGVGKVKFNGDIEAWLRDQNNMNLFQSCLSGNYGAWARLPSWVYDGLAKLKEAIKPDDLGDNKHESDARGIMADYYSAREGKD